MTLLAYPSRTITWGRAVNWDHPLNRGLVSWKLAGGPWKGATWHDLVSSQCDGTLTSMDPATDWVSPLGRPGGFGAIDTDGSNDVVVAASPAINSAPAATIGGWIYRSATGTKQSFGFNNSGATNFSILWFTDNKIYCNQLANFPNITSTLTGWHHLTLTYDGAATPRTVLYLDGVNASLGGTHTTATTLNAATGNVYWVGREVSNSFCTGQYDDLRVWSRALTPSEAWADYVDSRTGRPSTLNRVTSTRRLFNSVGGGGGNRRRRLLICGARA